MSNAADTRQQSWYIDSGWPQHVINHLLIQLRLTIEMLVSCLMSVCVCAEVPRVATGRHGRVPEGSRANRVCLPVRAREAYRLPHPKFRDIPTVGGRVCRRVPRPAAASSPAVVARALGRLSATFLLLWLS